MQCDIWADCAPAYQLCVLHEVINVSKANPETTMVACVLITDFSIL